MYHIKIKNFFISITYIFLFTTLLNILLPIQSYAMSIDSYPYKKIYDELPEKYQKSEYIYVSSDNVCLISFAKYKGNDYRTSIKMKKGTQEFLYCVDHNDSVEFTDNYSLNNEFFDNKLKTRLAILFYHGPKKWGEKASSEFTTDNAILDYYMTQVVAHSLIYKYGGEKSSYGIDFNSLEFKDNTTKLEKMTKALYEYCCNASIKYSDGNFQSIEFSFKEPSDLNMYLKDQNLVTSTIKCKTNNDNATVKSFKRSIQSNLILGKQTKIIAETDQYNSNLSLSIPIKDLDLLTPGNYNINLLQEILFERKLAGIWCCSEDGYVDSSQELGNLIEEEYNVNDSIRFNILIGKLYLYKKDSITLEDIADAKFQVFQFNETTNNYELYCDMTYNAELKRYESKNLYLSNHNKTGKFKVIETSPGPNYLLDWEGQTFEITKEQFIHELHIENQPIMGKLTIQKKGEQWSYQDNRFIKNDLINLPKVTYELYAKEDIYVKNKIKFPKDKKIVNLITNDKGVASVENLPMGTYYIKEYETWNDYILDTKTVDFTITRDQNRKYNEVKLSLINRLKTSQVQIFKCYYKKSDVEQKNPLPLKGAKFGLYLAKDLCDVYGNIILAKDSCISEKYSDENGNVVFDQLPYTEFYIKELEAPKDFILNDGIVSISFDDFQYNKEKNIYIYNQKIVNKKQTFNLCVKKTGEFYSDYKLEPSENGEFYSYQIGKKTLEGVTFSLYNSAKELLESQTTDSAGKVYFKDLFPGIYYIKETAAPDEYKLIELEKDITLNMSTEEYNEFSPPVIEEEFFNEYCNCSLTLTKYGELAYVKDSSLNYKYIPLKNIVFAIYQNFDYIFSDDKILPKGSCIGYIVTGENGIGTYEGKLPVGNYYIKEVQTNPGYRLDTKKYYFDIRSNHNQAISIRINEENYIINELSKASVEIIKTDSNTGKKLKNVEFTLYNNKDEQIGVYKTNKKGKILVENLPYGKYYFVETKSKNGYYSSNNKYRFDLNSENPVTLNITNTPILKLGYEENYKKALLITLIICCIVFITAFINLHRIKHTHEDE